MELKQEIEAIHSETTTGFQGLCLEIREEIINRPCLDSAQVVNEQADMAHSLTLLTTFNNWSTSSELKTKELKRTNVLILRAGVWGSSASLRELRAHVPLNSWRSIFHFGCWERSLPDSDWLCASITSAKTYKGSRAKTLYHPVILLCTKERITGLAKGKDPLTFRGTLVHQLIYPDLPAGMRKLWTTFSAVKAKLKGEHRL